MIAPKITTEKKILDLISVNILLEYSLFQSQGHRRNMFHWIFAILC